MRITAEEALTPSARDPIVSFFLTGSAIPKRDQTTAQHRTNVTAPLTNDHCGLAARIVPGFLEQGSVRKGGDTVSA